jgi:hypothetical protein
MGSLITRKNHPTRAGFGLLAFLLNLQKRYFQTSVVAVTIAITSLFTMFLPNVMVNAVSAQIEIISIDETSGNSVEIIFNSSIPKRQISNYTITATPDLSGFVGSGNSNTQQIKSQNKSVSKVLKRKVSGLINYEFKPIASAAPYTFKVCAKRINGKVSCSDLFEYPQYGKLLDQISRLPSDWANPRPIQTPAPTASLAAPAFTLSSSSQSVTFNSAITTVTNTSTGGTISSYSISPAAPAGLTFSNSTGQLSGTPTTPQSSTAYTITANNASGSATAIFTLTVSPGAAVKVAVTRASVGTSPGFAFTTQPQITIQDSAGNTITSSSAVVTATVSAGGALVGTATATASSGVATFSNLGIRGFGGVAYTITYTASGLTTDTQIVTPSALTRGANGPGGGLIYYVATTSAGFTCGPTRNETCYYLEVAPSNWSGGADPTKVWAVAAKQGSDITDISNDGSAYNNALGIGLGYKNSIAIVDQGNDTTSAAGTARAYTGGSLNDWYLPTTAEINLLSQWWRGITQDVTSNINGGTINASAGFTDGGDYHASSEGSSSTSWGHRFQTTPSMQGAGSKNASARVRPIRAF